MRRPSAQRPFACVSCRAGIVGLPVFHVGLAFCCAGCAAGGPCNCSYDDEDADDTRWTGPTPVE
jgi:hypothetical protein